MIPRSLPPVYSPVTPGALLAGCRAIVGRESSDILATLQQVWGARGILGTDSGTTALALALRQCNAVRPGLVALPAWSCYDLATAAVTANATVALYDLNPHTLGPDWESLRRALSLGATAVVLVHPYGVAPDVAHTVRVADAAGALVIEDAAQAAGASVEGRPAGAQGAFGVLSFGRGKGFTGGTGGALLLTPAAAEGLELPDASALGRAALGLGPLLKLAVQWALGRPSLYALPAGLPFLRLGQTIYRPPGRAGPLPVSAAGVLAATWPLVDHEVETRRRHAARLACAVEQVGGGSVPVGAGEASWLRLPVIAEESLRRRALSRDARRLGVAGGYPRLLIDLPGFAARVRNADDRFSGARALAECLVTLPTHSQLRPQDLDRLEQWLAD